MTGIQGLQPLCPRETITQTRQTEREILLVASSSLNFRPQTDWNQEREKEERRRGAKREGDKDKEGEREKRNAENRRKKSQARVQKILLFYILITRVIYLIRKLLRRVRTLINTRAARLQPVTVRTLLKTDNHKNPNSWQSLIIDSSLSSQSSRMSDRS